MAAAAADGSDVTIEVQLDSSGISPTATTQARAVIRDAQGNILSGRQITWSSGESSVAKVDTSGVITAVDTGSTVIRATSGSVFGSAAFRVRPKGTVAADPTECGSPRSGWIFCDDFETDRLSKYYEYDNAGGKFVRASSAGLGGSVGMRATYTTGQASAGHLSLALGRTPSSYFRPADAGTAKYRELYWRFYVLRAPGWVGDGAGKLTRATVFAKSDWSQAMIAHGWTDDSDKRYLMLDPASGTNTSGSVITSGYNDFAHLRWLGAARAARPVSDRAHVGVWQCYEFHVKLNTAGRSDGVFELFVNDTVSAQRTGLNWLGSYADYGLNAILLEQYQNDGAPAANVRTIDNFVVSTQRVGCGSSGSSTGGGQSPAPVPVATVQVSLASSTIAVGSTTQATATTLDGNGGVLSGRTISWSSSNTSVATVSGSGVVTGVSGGTANITATSEGRSDVAAVTVTSAPATAAALAITRQPSSTATTGSTFAQQPVVQLRDGSGNAVSRSGVVVTAALASGQATLSGTTSATTNSSGAATFTNLAIAQTGTYTLRFAASGLTAATSSAIAVTAPAASGGSSTEPKPSGTIVLDTRAGGAQDIQKAASIADVRAYWTKTGGVLNDIGFTTNYDGQGKHAFRIDWQANPSGESSYNDNAFYFPSTLSTVYTSVVIHLGKTATGGGVGTIGSFAPVSDRGGMKRIMWLRQRDNGTDRVYWVWPTEGQRTQQNALSIDNRNFNSYFNADYGIGTDVRWTFQLVPGNPGTLRVWRNGVLVEENTSAAIGTMGFSQLQFITTRFAAQQAETEYWSDLVVWKP